MGEELLRIWDATRKTVIFVTHSITEAIYLSDHVFVMGRNPGRIATKREIDLPRPRNTHVIGTEAFGHYRNEMWDMLTEDTPAPGGKAKAPNL